MADCIFCKIIKGEIPGDIVYENKDVLCFRDISPAAPVHVLIVPKEHYTNILDLNSKLNGGEAGDKDRAREVMSSLSDAINQVAALEGVAEEGFRLINNCGADGGQTVNHLHFHILGGKKLRTELL